MQGENSARHDRTIFSSFLGQLELEIAASLEALVALKEQWTTYCGLPCQSLSPWMTTSSWSRMHT